MRTIDDAELAGWEGLYVYCGCRVRDISWGELRRSSPVRDLREIASRLRCSKCGDKAKSVLLTRNERTTGGPKPVRAPIPERPGPRPPSV